MKDPRSLYKYRPFDEFTLEIIANKKIFFPKPDLFNDPYDCKIKIDNSLSLQNYIDLVTEEGHELGKHDLEIESMVSRIRSVGLVPDDFIKNVEDGLNWIHSLCENVGVLSLSEDPKNILMWAHYADDHKGMCIEFRRDYSNILGQPEATKKVVYASNYPKIKIMDFKKKKPKVIERILRTKSKDWCYEKEWRVIMGNGNELHPIPGEITAIIFGVKAPQRHIDIIRKLTNGSNIKLIQAEMLTNEYGIKIIKHI